MTITVGGTSITFNDGTTQTTAGGAPTSAQVLSAYASGVSFGGIGSYVIGIGGGGSGGTTVAGSSISYAGLYQNYSVVYWTNTSSTFSGTWRRMSNNGSIMLLVRIA